MRKRGESTFIESIDVSVFSFIYFAIKSEEIYSLIKMLNPVVFWCVQIIWTKMRKKKLIFTYGFAFCKHVRFSKVENENKDLLFINK